MQEPVRKGVLHSNSLFGGRFARRIYPLRETILIKERASPFPPPSPRRRGRRGEGGGGAVGEAMSLKINGLEQRLKSPFIDDTFRTESSFRADSPHGAGPRGSFVRRIQKNIQPSLASLSQNASDPGRRSVGEQFKIPPFFSNSPVFERGFDRQLTFALQLLAGHLGSGKPIQFKGRFKTVAAGIDG